MEIGTLKELNVKPGDVVEWLGTSGRKKDFVAYKIGYAEGGVFRDSEDGVELSPYGPWRIISRATQSPVRNVTRITTHGTWSPRGKMPKTQYVYEVEFEIDENGHPDWKTATVKGK